MSVWHLKEYSLVNSSYLYCLPEPTELVVATDRHNGPPWAIIVLFPSDKTSPV